MDERADVVVVGSGAAGAALAWRLAGHGAKVVCLEQGGWVGPEEFPSSRRDFEAHIGRGRFSFFPNVRKRWEDYPVATEGLRPDQVLMWNGVGGSTVHWEGHFPRLHPSDFRVRTLDGVADDWPIRYEDLEPYYDLNDRNVGVSGLAGDPANPPRAPRPTPALPIRARGMALVRGFEQLGWHWWPADNAILSREYDGREPCDLRGRCNFGCPRRARASADVVYWPRALKLGTVLKTRARAHEIAVAADGRVEGVVYSDRGGTVHRQLARVVVVCCNGIGTPRLLLASRSRLFPDGLANSNGVLGRNYMVHPSRYVEGVFEERIDGHAGITSNTIFSQQFYETETGRGFVRGYSLLAYGPMGPLTQAWGDVEPVPWGSSHHAEMRRRFGHTVGLAVMAEDLPEEANRVELDGRARDPSGVPAPRVRYRYSENSLRMLAHGVSAARRVLEAAGAREVRATPEPNVSPT